MKMMRLRGPNGLLSTVTIASATTQVVTILVHHMYVCLFWQFVVHFWCDSFLPLQRIHSEGVILMDSLEQLPHS